MAETVTARTCSTFSALDTIVNGSLAAVEAPAAKKAKTVSIPSHSQRVLTFSVAHSPTKVQVLSTHTIHDLVDIFCRETTIGRNESVDDHLWNIRFPGTGGAVYESGDHPCESQLRAKQTKLGDLRFAPKTCIILNYDYGDGLEYKITFVEDTTESISPDGESLFPRRKPTAVPTGYIQHVTKEVNLNSLFPTFNKWAFQQGHMVSLNLFQAGRKNNYGFCQRGNDGVRHMIYLPCKAGKDLSVYLHCFDYATQFSYATYEGGPEYSWYSMVVCPDIQKTAKYQSQHQTGFMEVSVATYPPNLPFFNAVFPKLAALAGYKKDKKVPRGWLTYQNKTLRICSGATAPHKSNAPKGTAWDGNSQHDPVDESAVLFQMDTAIDSLQHLFSVAEGLLETL